MNSIFDFLNGINQIANESDISNKECVDGSLAASALYCVSYLCFVTLGDVCLFCAANNLLNSYVKQTDSNISYYFKSSVYRLIAALECLNIDGLYISE